MEDIRYWVWLSQLNISPKARAAVMIDSAEEAFRSKEGSFRRKRGISAQEAELLEARSLEGVDELLEQCAEQELSVLTYDAAEFPERLRRIACPPAVLYVKGLLPSLDLLPVTLRAGRPCIGVLGTPHEQCRLELARDLLRGGALISEYPPGKEFSRHFFRERNRIAAGISDGVVVVEAPEKSGTRLFVNDAVDQGKDVFAVPGNVDAENAAGTLALLKDGAKLVTCGAEVMEDYLLRYPDCINLDPELEETTEEKETEPEETAEREGNEAPAKDSRTALPAADPAKPSDAEAAKQALLARLSQLTDDQLKIITAIDPGSTHIDDITERTGLSTSRVLAQLTVLEIKGFVRREAGRRFALNITVEK